MLVGWLVFMPRSPIKAPEIWVPLIYVIISPFRGQFILVFSVYSARAVAHTLGEEYLSSAFVQSSGGDGWEA